MKLLACNNCAAKVLHPHADKLAPLSGTQCPACSRGKLEPR